MDNRRTVEEIDEQIRWMDKRIQELKKSVNYDDPFEELAMIAKYKHQIYALTWARGSVSGYRF